MEAGVKVVVHPPHDRGVTELMYVGDDESVFGTTPWKDRLPKIALAIGLLYLLFRAGGKR